MRQTDLIPLLQHVTRYVGRKLRIAEVGCWEGASAIWLAEYGHVTCIDLWKPGYDSNDEISQLSAQRFDAAECEFDRNIRGRAISKLVMGSHEAAQMFTRVGTRFDLVYLDASHTTDALNVDIDAWLRLTTFLGGHDYGNPTFPGVKRSVDLAFKDIRVWGMEWLVQV